MKKIVKNLLYRTPRLLAETMRIKSNWNRDKYVFLKLLRKGDTVLDVGGNIGDYCTTFAKTVGPKGHVHTFEPVPPTIENLEGTILKEHLKNVTLVKKAVSNLAGNIEIHMPGDDHARPSIGSPKRKSWDISEKIRSFPCEATTLDLYMHENSLERVNFLKIDVEGAEYLVLEGGNDLLASHQPILFFEMWDSYMHDFGTTPIDFCEIILGAGYDRFTVIQDILYHFNDLKTELPRLLRGGILNLVCGKSSLHNIRFKSL